jgi:transposase
MNSAVVYVGEDVAKAY